MTGETNLNSFLQNYKVITTVYEAGTTGAGSTAEYFLKTIVIGITAI